MENNLSPTSTLLPSLKKISSTIPLTLEVISIDSRDSIVDRAL